MKRYLITKGELTITILLFYFFITSLMNNLCVFDIFDNFLFFPISLMNEQLGLYSF